MSTTQAKLTRLLETKTNIRQKLISLGVDVPIDTPFKDYPSLIEQLGGIEFIETTTDQDLLQMADLYRWLGSAEYVDYVYTDEEIASIHAMLDLINDGKSEATDEPDVPESNEPYLVILNVGQTTYYPGDMFNLDGYIIRVAYRDGTIIDVSNGCTFTPNRALTREDTQVEINCIIDGITLSYVQPIYVVYTLDYIESTGTQYIDTNILSTNVSRIDMSFTPLINTTSWESICYIEKNSSPWSGFGLRLNTTQQFAFGCGTNSAALTDITPVMGQRYNFEWHCSTGELLLDETNYEIPIVNSPFSGDLYIFAANTLASGSDGSPSMYGKIRLHDFKIYDKNDKLVRHYIPAKDKSGVVCLRELVSRTYVYNKGSGTFTAGLLQEPEQLDYIQSTGTQYIDTGVVPAIDVTYEISVDIDKATVKTDGCLFGSRTKGGTDQYILWDNYQDDNVRHIVTPTFYSYDNSNTIYLENTANIFKYDGKTFYINGEATKDVTNSMSVAKFTMYLFALNESGSKEPRTYKGKLYYFKLYKNGVMIRHFIPYKDGYGIACLKDLVEDKYYYNAGEGSFIAGLKIEEEVVDNE